MSLWGLQATDAAAFDDYKNVPDVFVRVPSVFQSLWGSAKTKTVRIALFGDSQENGKRRGEIYVLRLNYEMWKRFGNVPETPLAGYGSYGAPPERYGEWLLRGKTVRRLGGSPSRVPEEQRPPGVNPSAHSTKSYLLLNVNRQWFGQLTMLQQDASSANPAAEIPRDLDYFKTDGTVKAEIFAATNSSSGEVYYRARPTSSAEPSYWSGETTAGEMTLGLESKEFAVKSGTTAPLDYAGKKYMAVEIHGSNSDKLTDILGVRFLNETHPEGAVVTDLSRGGYTIKDFLDKHAAAGDLIRALDFHAAILHYGANDADTMSAQDFKTYTETMIALIRSWSGKPDLAVILLGDPDRNELTAEQRAQFDQFPGAQYAIAQADKHVMFVNSRHVVEVAAKWYSGSPELGTLLVDFVHYTPKGAQVLAGAEVAKMLGF